MTVRAPKVSVIIPCYNGERFITEAIESVLAQSFRDFELIIVNDGSTDRSSSLARQYLSNTRVRYVEHPENRGIAAARNTGIREAVGSHIAFLDQDDLWREDKLEKQMNVFAGDAAGEIGLVFSDREIVVVDRGYRTRRFKGVPAAFNALSREKALEALYMRNFIPMVSVLVRRECLDDVGWLDESIRSGGDDYEFCTRILRRYRIFHVAEPLVTRREHAANFTDDGKLMPDAIAVNRRLAEQYPNLARLRHRREGELLFKLGRALQEKGEYSRAKRAYRDAIRARPLYVRPYLGLILSNLGRLGTGILAAWHRLRNSA